MELKIEREFEFPSNCQDAVDNVSSIDAAATVVGTKSLIVSLSLLAIMMALLRYL